MSELQTPCYVVSSDGFRDSVSYQDDWCYGPSRLIGESADDSEVTAMIHADIREAFDERNGIPYYFISDHGNIDRRRAIRLRNRVAS